MRSTLVLQGMQRAYRISQSILILSLRREDSLVRKALNCRIVKRVWMKRLAIGTATPVLRDEAFLVLEAGRVLAAQKLAEPSSLAVWLTLLQTSLLWKTCSRLLNLTEHRRSWPSGLYVERGCEADLWRTSLCGTWKDLWYEVLAPVIHSTPHFQHSFTRERSAQRQRQRYDIRLSRTFSQTFQKRLERL